MLSGTQCALPASLLGPPACAERNEHTLTPGLRTEMGTLGPSMILGKVF